MLNNEKIEIAEKRIIELQILIQHWKKSNILSRKATADYVAAMLSKNFQNKAA